MAKPVILGTDIARDAFKTKVNDNFTELYDKDVAFEQSINTLDANKADKNQENLIAVTPQNGWTQSAPNLSYYKDTTGRVHLWGQLQGGTPTPDTVVATLPVGYRPVNTVRNTAIKTNDGSIFSVAVAGNGNIVLGVGLSTTGTIAISLSFRAV